MNLFRLKFILNKVKCGLSKTAKAAPIVLLPEYTLRLLRTQLQIVFCLALVAVLVPLPQANAQKIKPTPRALFLNATEDVPKNVILLIGDGMGEEHIIAASMYANGTHDESLLELAPYQAKMMTHSANSPITDSAASATAMATGQKVNNGVISVDIPGDGQRLETALEYFRDRCKSTGLVVTSVINHATPAAFASHAYSRVEYRSLLENYFQLVLPDVIMGGGAGAEGDTYATDAGYTIVSNRAGLDSLVPEDADKVYGRFGYGDMPFEHEYQLGMNAFYDEHPHLSEMTAKSLELLEDDEDGFFLLVEGSRIDHAGHGNALPHMIHEVLEFEQTVQTVLEWAEGRDDTLVIVTADHETGGLLVTQNLGAGEFPSSTWSTTAHTATDVNVYAWGPNAELVTGVIDNTDIYGILTANNIDMPSCAIENAPPQTTTALPPPPRETSDVTLRWQTDSETNVSGFQIMRSTDGVFDHSVPLTTDLILADGSGSYEYTDVGRLVYVDYTYWLVIVGDDGATTVTDQVDVPRSRYIGFIPLVSL